MVGHGLRRRVDPPIWVKFKNGIAHADHTACVTYRANADRHRNVGIETPRSSYGKCRAIVHIIRRGLLNATQTCCRFICIACFLKWVFMRKPKSGGGWAAIKYTLQKSGEAGGFW